MPLPIDEQDPRTRPSIACAIEVHAALGPGLLEAPYQAAMQIALTSAGNKVEREKSFPALFRGLEIGHYRPDLIVNNEVVVEIKSVERYDPVSLAQMLTYLRVTRLQVGLIINFNRPRVVDGIKRVSL
jgi:GxxExxY protein